MKDRVALIIAGLTAAFHLALANRYDVFRDELYFVVCGRHPAFGYADQPPLVPLLAAGTYALGAQTWLLRLPSVLAAAALVWLVIAFTRLLGGRSGAAILAGIAIAIAPMFMGLTATLNTTTFEPLAWTAVAYGLSRAILIKDRGALVWSGVVAGLAMEAKYALPAWLIALAIALLITERRVFAQRELWLGLAVAFVLALPSVIWQATHGWPFVALLHAAGDKNTTIPPLAFIANQILVFNPLLAPIWLTGLIAPLAIGYLRTVRFVPIAYAIVAVLIYTSHGKDYYLAPAYPPLFALGAVALENLIAPVVRTGYLTAAIALSALIAPITLPILAPATLVAYEQRLHLARQAQEKLDTAALPQMFADQLGWHDFVHEVATAYAALPANQRATAAILVDNYGEASALELYGPAYGLPPALSGHNQYALWALRGQHPTAFLRVHREPNASRQFCKTLHVLGTTFSPYAMPYENGKAITLCTGLRLTPAEILIRVSFFA